MRVGREQTACQDRKSVAQRLQLHAVLMNKNTSVGAVERRARLHSPILMLLGKLEHEHQPSKLVSSKARLGSMFPFAFAKMSRIPNIYPTEHPPLHFYSAAVSASNARYNASARSAPHRTAPHSTPHHTTPRTLSRYAAL